MSVGRKFCSRVKVVGESVSFDWLESHSIFQVDPPGMRTCRVESFCREDLRKITTELGTTSPAYSNLEMVADFTNRIRRRSWSMGVSKRVGRGTKTTMERAVRSSSKPPSD